MFRTLKCHTSWVDSLTLLPNGNLVSAGSYNDYIRIWDTSNTYNWKSIRKFFAHKLSFKTLVLLQNGHLAIGCSDKTIRILNPSNGERIRTIKTHWKVLSLCLLSNGQLASAGFNKKINIWDPTNGELKRTLVGHTARVYVLTLLPNGNLASGSSDNTIKIWDTSNDTLLITFVGHTKSVSSLVCLPNGYLASGSDDKTIKIWDTSNGSLVITLNNYTSVYSLILLPNNHLASGSSGTIKIWDTSNGTLLKKLKCPQSEIHSFALLANGQLVSGSWKNINIWETSSYNNLSPEGEEENLDKSTFGERFLSRECPICLENIYNSRRKIVVTHCGHFFCKLCFDSFLDEKDPEEETITCPYCTNRVWDAQKYASVVFP